jgi:hypothetical protein
MIFSEVYSVVYIMNDVVSLMGFLVNTLKLISKPKTTEISVAEHISSSVL